MKSIAVLSNLLHHLYRGIQCDKTHNFVHGETFEVQHEICRFRHGFKRQTHRIYYESPICIKVSQDVTKAAF